MVITAALLLVIVPAWAEDTEETALEDDDAAELAQKLANPTAFGVALTSETTYNWETENWSVPLNLSVSQMVPIGKMPVSFQAGVRYWADSPENGPEGWGFRVAMIMVLPK